MINNYLKKRDGTWKNVNDDIDFRINFIEKSLDSLIFFMNTKYKRLNVELNYRTTRNFELHRLSGITKLDIPKNDFIGMIKKVIQHPVAKN